MYIIRNDLLKKLAELPFFNLMAIRQLKDCGPAAARQTLTRWHQAGRIIRLKKDCYISRDFYLSHRQDSDWLMWLSGVIQPFSYVSGIFVLQNRGVLTDTTYPVTAVTGKNTKIITNQLGEFTYAHIRPELYGGYTVKHLWGADIRQAALGKALFDYLYFRADPVWELRLNLEEFSAAEIKDYNHWVKISRVKRIPLWNRLLKN